MTNFIDEDSDIYPELEGAFWDVFSDNNYKNVIGIDLRSWDADEDEDLICEVVFTRTPTTATMVMKAIGICEDAYEKWNAEGRKVLRDEEVQTHYV